MDQVVLIGPEVEENLGVRYLSSALQRAGFGTQILSFARSSELATILSRFRQAGELPAVVALSLSFQVRALDFLSLAIALRELGYQGHITAGGHFGTFECRNLLRDFPELDSICLFEAEEVIVDLARAVRDQRPLEAIPGLAVRAAGGGIVFGPNRSAPALSQLPRPDRRGDPARCLGHGIAPLISSRGCYAHCTFCCIAAWQQEIVPGTRFRLRSVEDVAEEMAELQRQRGIDLFLFHDDNFFVPGQAQSLERIQALADALTAKKMKRFGTMVKARPTDVSEEVFRALRDRLGCIRVYLGVETDSLRGLRTLGRQVAPGQNRAALAILEKLGLYVCYNLLLFDPDTTVEDLDTNLAFLADHAHAAFKFGRVELYAGTPLLKRMQSENRVRGDYLGWDYSLASESVERVFEHTMTCLGPRNFPAGCVTDRLMGIRFTVETCRRMRPELFEEEWLQEARALVRSLNSHTIATLRCILDLVQSQPLDSLLLPRIQELAVDVRAVDSSIGESLRALQDRIECRVGERCLQSLSAGDALGILSQ